MRGNRSKILHFSGYRDTDTTGAGARQSDEAFIQAPGAPRRLFTQLANSTPELAKCFRMARLVPGASPQGDRLIQEVHGLRQSDPLHYHDLGNLREAHTGGDDGARIISGDAGSRSDPDEDVRAGYMEISMDDDVPGHDHDPGSTVDPLPRTLRGMRNLSMT
jgi:hypothetical protein